jgi:hypothetical protein
MLFLLQFCFWNVHLLPEKPICVLHLCFCVHNTQNKKTCLQYTKHKSKLTQLSYDVVKSLVLGVNLENLLLPFLLVVGEPLEELEEKLVTMLPCLAG